MLTKALYTTLAIMLAAPGVSAQEEISPRDWTITTSLRTSPEVRVICSLTFPQSEGEPRLRITQQAGDVEKLSFDIRGAGVVASADPAELTDITIAAGANLEIGAVQGQWRSVNDGRLEFALRENTAQLLARIGQANTLSVKTGTTELNFPLQGSLRAISEFLRCTR